MRRIRPRVSTNPKTVKERERIDRMKVEDPEKYEKYREKKNLNAKMNRESRRIRERDHFKRYDYIAVKCPSCFTKFPTRAIHTCKCPLCRRRMTVKTYKVEK